MHPLFNQQLAQQHMDDLRHEAEIAQTAAHMNTAENSKRHEDKLGFLQSLYSRTSLSYRRTVTQQTTRPDEVSLEEIKPAVLTTFSVMREGGLVSEYDEQFIEKFVQTLEHELTLQARCNRV
jgi:hypothetical protein